MVSSLGSWTVAEFMAGAREAEDDGAVLGVVSLVLHAASGRQAKRARISAVIFFILFVLSFPFIKNLILRFLT